MTQDHSSTQPYSWRWEMFDLVTHNTFLGCTRCIRLLNPIEFGCCKFLEDREIRWRTPSLLDSNDRQDISLELSSPLRNNVPPNKPCMCCFHARLDKFQQDKESDSLIPLDSKNLLDTPTHHRHLDSLCRLGSSSQPSIDEWPTRCRSADSSNPSRKMDNQTLPPDLKMKSSCLEDTESERRSRRDSSGPEDKCRSQQWRSPPHKSLPRSSHGKSRCRGE
jgi:hypothetical protein